jgi:hypothetical protein
MCYHRTVRTTLDLDDDILHVARQLATQRDASIGRVVSDLARQALAPKSAPRIRNGVPLFEPRPGARKPHLALVNRLRDES